MLFTLRGTDNEPSTEFRTTYKGIVPHYVDHFVKKSNDYAFGTKGDFSRILNHDYTVTELEVLIL
jgi:hypothetical protein